LKHGARCAPRQQAERQLAAVVAADIAGCPRLMGAVPHLAGRTDQERITDAVRQQVIGFDRFFHESTVIGEIANLNIGSRPSSRTASARVEDLRAIPWVRGGVSGPDG